MTAPVIASGEQIPSLSIIRGRVKFVAGVGEDEIELTSMSDKSSFYLSYSHPTLESELGHLTERRVLLDKDGYFSFWLAPELVSQANVGDRFIYVWTENSLRRKIYLPGYSGTIPSDFNHLAWNHGSSSTSFLDLALKYGDVDGDNQIQTAGTDAAFIAARDQSGLWLVPPVLSQSIHLYRTTADLNRDRLITDADEALLELNGLSVTNGGAQ